MKKAKTASPKEGRNRPLRLPVTFNQAVDALLATKPKKPQPKK